MKWTLVQRSGQLQSWMEDQGTIMLLTSNICDFDFLIAVPQTCGQVFQKWQVRHCCKFLTIGQMMIFYQKIEPRMKSDITGFRLDLKLGSYFYYPPYSLGSWPGKRLKMIWNLKKMTKLRKISKLNYNNPVYPYLQATESPDIRSNN